MDTRKNPTAANDGAYLNLKLHAKYKSRNAQRVALAGALLKAGSQGLSTIEVREGLGIIHPAGRICELRQSGHDILMRMEWSIDAQGYRHAVARYFLISLPVVGGEL